MGKDTTPTEPPAPEVSEEVPPFEPDPRLITYLEKAQGAEETAESK